LNKIVELERKEESNHKPIISILMPVFNAEKYLTECLDSIQSQSFKNWELIAVDDYSLDNSYSILKQRSEEDSRVCLFQNSGKKGIIPSLKLAFSKAKGVYLSRMDADDIMHEEKIELLHQALLENPSKEIAVPLVSYFAEQGVGEGYKNYEQWLNNLTAREKNFEDIYKECVIPSPAWMIERSNFIKAGAFDFNLYPEDYDLCFRWYKENYHVIKVDKVLHYWRDYKDRSSRTDPNYADQNFNALKLEYFISLDYKSDKKLILWGAGKKAKKIAKILINKKVAFDWVTNNTAKINHIIYGVKMQAQNIVMKKNEVQIIMALSGPSDKEEAECFFKTMDLIKNQDYFMFY